MTMTMLFADVMILMLEIQDFFVYKWKDDFVQHHKMDHEKSVLVCYHHLPSLPCD